MSELTEMEKALLELRLLSPKIDKVISAELIRLQNGIDRYGVEILGYKVRAEKAEAQVSEMRECLEEIKDTPYYEETCQLIDACLANLDKSPTATTTPR